MSTASKTLDQVEMVHRGVVFAVVLQYGRLAGSAEEVQMRYASANARTDGLFERITDYADIERARGGTEGLAEERR